MESGDLLPLVVVIASSFISALLIVRHSGIQSQDSTAWQALSSELRDERDRWRELAITRGEQLEHLGHVPATMTQIETLSALAHDIEHKFSIDELDAIAFDLGIKPEDIAGDTLPERARQLVLMMDRRGRLERLIVRVKQERSG